MFCGNAQLILQSLQLNEHVILEIVGRCYKWGECTGSCAILSEPFCSQSSEVVCILLTYYHVTELERPKFYENQAEGFHTNDALVGVFFKDCVFME